VAFATTLKVRSSPSACADEISGRATSRALGRHLLPKAVFVVMSLTYITMRPIYTVTRYRVIEGEEKLYGECERILLLR
jgi:hypothetical protein